jgi:hypothetical protein
VAVGSCDLAVGSCHVAVGSCDLAVGSCGLVVGSRRARPGCEYRAQECPVAQDVCERRLVLGQSFSSPGPPNGLDTMATFADVFTKVLTDERDALIGLARDGAARVG